jgi:hypothetical protein
MSTLKMTGYYTVVQLRRLDDRSGRFRIAVQGAASEAGEEGCALSSTPAGRSGVRVALRLCRVGARRAMYTCFIVVSSRKRTSERAREATVCRSSPPRRSQSLGT